MKSVSRVSCMLAAIALSLSVERGNAQEPAPTPDSAPATEPASAADSQPGQMIIIERAVHEAALAEVAAEAAASDIKLNEKRWAIVNGGFGSPPRDGAIRELAAKIRDTNGEAAQATMTQQLTNLLDQHFEQDMAERNHELQDIQARVQKLQVQLDRRRAKKQEIVDLQLKVVLNEADGLGFYNPATGSGFNFQVETPVTVSPVGATFTPSPVPPPPPVKIYVPATK